MSNKNYSLKVLNESLIDLRKTKDFFLKQGNEYGADEVRKAIRQVEKSLILLNKKTEVIHIDQEAVNFMSKNFIAPSEIANFYNCTTEVIIDILEDRHTGKQSATYRDFLLSAKNNIEIGIKNFDNRKIERTKTAVKYKTHKNIWPDAVI